jgi:hypothetical protein
VGEALGGVGADVSADGVLACIEPDYLAQTSPPGPLSDFGEGEQ